MNEGARLDRFGLAFRCLGWMFLQAPDPETTGVLMGLDARGGWVLDGAEARTRTGLEQLRAARDGWGPDTPAALTADYNRLFVGPGPLLAPPWESAHRGVDRGLFDHHTLAVRAWFARFGMEAPNLGREPDDHLGLELAFLARLCDLGRDDPSGEILRAIRGFLDDHLLAWGPGCLEQVLAGARTLYFRGLANLALGCLDQAAAAFRGEAP